MQKLVRFLVCLLVGHMQLSQLHVDLTFVLHVKIRGQYNMYEYIPQYCFLNINFKGLRSRKI